MDPGVYVVDAELCTDVNGPVADDAEYLKSYVYDVGLAVNVAAPNAPTKFGDVYVSVGVPVPTGTDVKVATAVGKVAELLLTSYAVTTIHTYIVGCVKSVART